MIIATRAMCDVRTRLRRSCDVRSTTRHTPHAARRTTSISKFTEG